MTTIDNLIKSALETGLDCAQDIAHQVHEQYKGYKPHRHVAVDADVAQIKAALEALAKDGYLIGEVSKAQPVREPLSDEQIEKLRDKTFTINNPFCPVDSKSMRKAVRAAELAHGIGGGK